MKKFSMNLAGLALIAGAVFGFTSRSAATVATGKTTATVWFYNASGTSQADLQNGANWSTNNSGSCSASGTRPCQITAEADDQVELTDHLSNYTKSQILAMSVNRKP